MAEFSCRVASQSGEVFERSYVAADESALRRDLESQDLLVLNVRQQNPIMRQLSGIFRFRRSIPSKEFLLFNKELSALIRAGLPIVPSLDILLERRKNEVFRTALQDIRNRVKAGEALSEAFAAQGGMFPSLYSASLASGERSGEMATVLNRYISYAHKVLNLQAKVVSALVYPVILLVLSVCLIGLMVFYIIPKFNEFLVDFGAELPLMTKMLVGFALFCTEYWYLILAGSIATVVSVVLWNKSASGKLFFDGLKLRLPLVGGIMRSYAQNRLTRTLATLQSGGIPLVVSMELSSRAVGNSVFERGLTRATERVREGESLWESLDQESLLSDITVQMIKVGESTGMLVEMLENSSDFTDEEIDTQLTRLVAVIEPMMLVFMAGVVAVMLLSIYLPLLQAYGGQGGF